MHLSFLERFYPNFKGKKILDLGCGRGDFLLECSKRGLDVIGLDVNPKYIKICEEKLKENNFKVNIVDGRGEKIPFPDETFDFINCSEVLEHTDSPLKVLEECYRVLKKDGCIFITVVSRFSIKDAHYKLLFLNWLPRYLGKKYIKLRKKIKYTNQCPDKQEINEMHYYTYSKFKKIAQRLSFKLDDTRKIQFNNPELILDKNIRKYALLFKKIRMNFIPVLLYLFLRFFYFNSFHFLLKKKPKIFIRN